MNEESYNYTKASSYFKISEINRISSGTMVLVEGRIIPNSGKTFLQDSTGVIELNTKKGCHLNKEGDISLISGVLIKKKGKATIKVLNVIETINLFPCNLSSTFNNKPEIYALFRNSNMLLYKSSIRMYVDNKEIIPITQSDKILYIPDSPLTPGEHFVSINFNDNNGTISCISWMFNIEIKNNNYRLLFGVPHAHTSISDGKGLPAKAIDYTRKNGLDFLFITDHSNFFDGVCKDNYEFDRLFNEYKETINSDWYNTEVSVKECNSSFKNFIALRGFEMTSENWGHINVLNSSGYVEGKHQLNLIEDFFSWIKKQRNIVTVINHPGSHFKKVINHLEMDGIINLIEVGNGAFPRKYRRFEKHYYNALDNGWHLGAINGQDNHIDNWGDSENLTVIISEALTIEDILYALKNRHTYSTESRHLKLMVKANGYIMGSILPSPSINSIDFEINVENLEIPINCIQIISNGGNIVREEHFENTKQVFWKTSISTEPKNNWYVVKVILSDEKSGISSPIFTS